MKDFNLFCSALGWLLSLLGATMAFGQTGAGIVILLFGICAILVPIVK